ncbi:MAG: ABC transporter ATP-binding protein [Rectinema subterraneum]|uniref:ABC transporter ATP-binding protein n=1 Tax=Rectinema subterraneum TaxID=2653714 RepID=UPI003C7A856D
MSEPIIFCENLTKTFSSSAEVLRILDNADFVLEKGKACTILGPSGSGKSTFLAILGSLERFDSGTVKIAGYDLGQAQEKMLHIFRREVIGFVFQFHFLLNDFTALENVAIPAYMAGVPHAESWDRAKKLLDLVGLNNRATHFPSQLSGGERQRVAIARALINQPSVVLADEPTGNLDPASASAVKELLKSLPEIARTTLVLVTHDPELAGIGDSSYLLKGGHFECIR